MEFRSTPRQVLAGAIVAWLFATSVYAQSLQVIDLQHRTAQDVIPILQPLLEPGAALSGQDSKLFVRTSNANLVQIRAALAQIDRRPRQLLVSVRQAAQGEIERERASASATIGTDAAVASVNERPHARSGVTVRATESNDGMSNGSIASVQVLEGASALISTGSSAPIVTTVAAGGGRRPWAVSSTSFRDLSSGFLVTPRVNGELVVLEIEQQQEGIDRGQIRGQRLATQLGARLGEWVQLGGLSESATSESRGMLTRSYQTRSDERSIWVKVDAP
jgi:type II secretory pathway component GspD/PulD (secretin)